MRIVLLSKNPKLYSTRRMVEAATAAGHEMLVVDPFECALVLGGDGPDVLYRGEPLRDVDVVLPRIGTNITEYGVAVVAQFGMMGIPVVNDASAIMRSRDKLRCLQLLARKGIDIPKTVIARNPRNVERAIEMVDGTPVILKLLQGTQGVGVMIAESRQAVESVLDTLWGLGQNILIQQFVSESKGRDIRALVLGDKVVCAMERRAKMGEFRSNIHRGGYGEIVKLDARYSRAAIEATRVVGLQIAGVDMLVGKDGPKVMEINSSPGFEGLEKATGKDVARMLVDFAAEYARPVVRPYSGRAVARR
ncbi:MAG TPA: 30S ribosomal protein S6--L-glutamate ligase [bacterium]|nr:30S ribosomal protein S6--L-glutamate ligase [bacterium]